MGPTKQQLVFVRTTLLLSLVSPVEERTTITGPLPLSRDKVLSILVLLVLGTKRPSSMVPQFPSRNCRTTPLLLPLYSLVVKL